MTKTIQAHSHKLGQFFATAISGNDILSSSLYVSGIAVIFAGVYAPLVLFSIAVVLFFYRTVYREVVEALPVNGGAYNGLLNGTSKTVAAIAGVMTILSYIATAVISAKTAIEYFLRFVIQFLEGAGQTEIAEHLEIVIIPAIIVVLLAFAALVISGVKDSAKVAAGIFSFHIFTLIGFIIVGAWSALTGHSFFHTNLEITNTIVASHHGLLPTLFLAFSACLLGVSGFESSANFVEEQEKGVFRKTLRNMLIGVAIFNPLIALVVLSVMPVEAIAQAKDFLLAEASFGMGGLVLLGWIAIDAFLVLCGAVLTSYIGVSGLVNRMALDDCLPSFLIKENSKGSHPRIIWMFFLLCTSILLVTKGDLLSLAGVYTISFLGVMTLFALGNLILRQTRPELKRPYTAPFFFVVFAFFATAVGIIGNSLIDPHNDFFFLTYFVPAMLVVLLNIYRQQMVGGLMKVTRWLPPLHRWLSKVNAESVDQRFYIFIHHANLLYKAIEYVHRNENGWNITFIHCKRGEKGQRKELEELIPVLQNAGFYPHLNLQFEYIDEEFSADLVQKYAARRRIPRNRIFIGSIHHHHEFDYDDFGGVRIIS